MSNFTRLLLFAAAWLMLLLAACAAPAPTATATPTFTPEPTLTFTPAPTATGTPAPTATPEPSPPPALLPADVLATLQGQEYTTVDSDGDKNIDKVVAANGENLYLLNPEGNWQRMITFTLEGGDKMEMFRFDTPEEAYDYMVKNIAWGEMNIAKVKSTEEINFYQEKIFKISLKVGREFASGLLLANTDSSRSHIMIYNAGDGAIIAYRSEGGNLQAIYVDESVSTVFFWMDQSRR